MYYILNRLKQTVCFLLVFVCTHAYAQNNICPLNLDFELGNFNNWQCYIGSVTNSGTTNIVNVSASAPTTGRHTIIPASNTANDQYGNFPQHCPNSSGYSVKLGNNGIGAQAERVSYTFTIPATATSYSIVYQYAVVFQDGGSSHQPYHQARFEAKVKDVSTNSYINCGSYTYTAASSIPGFTQSSVQSGVWWKQWTPVTINLSGYAGKTIILEFTTADCTQSGHFGYAYVDVNVGCTAPITGATYCPGSTSVNLTAPYGYQYYTWYSNDFSQIYANTATLTVTPPPPTNTTLALEVIPYPGFGCKDTIRATLRPHPAVVGDAGPDQFMCAGNSLTVGTTAVGGYTYNWQAALGLSSTTVSNPTVTATDSTKYYLTITDTLTGCTKKDTVAVNVGHIPPANAGPDVFACSGTALSIGSSGNTAFNYVWSPSTGLSNGNISNPTANPADTTRYILTVTDPLTGCSKMDTVMVNVGKSPQANAGTDYFMCAGQTYGIGMTAVVGNNYSWSPSTGLNSSTVSNPTASPTDTTLYILTVTDAASGCTKKDSVELFVGAIPPATFSVNAAGQCITGNNFVFTNNNPAGNNYRWTFGDNGNSPLQSPSYSYTAVGSYPVWLVATSAEGCMDSTTQTVNVYAMPSGNISNASTIICEGTPVVLTSSGGSTYNWYLNGVLITGSTAATLNATLAGTYTADIISQYGCKSPAGNSVALTLTKKPTADFSFNKFCLGLPTTFINNSQAASSLPVTYSWDFGNGTTSSLFNEVITYAAGGTYNVKLSVTPTNCPQLIATIQKPVKIEVPAPGISYIPENAVENKPIQLNARNFGATYQWRPATFLNNTAIRTPLFTGNKELQYLITIVSPAGCTTVDTQQVRIFKETEIYVPKGFTPNADGRNDYLYPFLVGIKELNFFRIINRWGVVVYQSKTDLPGWDGFYKGKAQPMDGYMWEAKGIDIYGKEIIRQGSFTLIR